MYSKRNYGIMPGTFGGFLGDVLHTSFNHLNEEISSFSAPVNIQETSTSYELQLVAPGLKKEDLKLNLDRNIMHISFEQKDQKDANKEQPESKWLRSEYRMRSFKRSFTLNEKIDVTKIAAKYADGILHVTMPKKEVTEPTAQEISVN